VTTPPRFPPLFQGLATSGRTDPFTRACAQAALGCDSGLVVHNIAADMLGAAIVFAPELPLQQAMAAMIACGVGFQNALGALAPPEVAVFLTWAGGIQVNGANCGRLRVAASHSDPATEPAWLVVGLQVPLIPQSPDAPGLTPDLTCLYEEGCADVDPTLLLEAWTRHSLLWINRLIDDGPRALNDQWRGLAVGLGEEIAFDLGGTRHAGTFLGVDENFGMLLRHGDDTSLLPLSAILETGAVA